VGAVLIWDAVNPSTEARSPHYDCARAQPTESAPQRRLIVEIAMSRALIFALLVAGLPAAAHAQDANSGAIDAPPPAAGTTTGGAVDTPQLGTVPGSDAGLTKTNQPTFRHYVLVDQRTPSYEWLGHPNVAVGDVLPTSGVHYHDVPPEYGSTRYRYTVVDHQPVLVDPYTRRVVQVFQ
jgi:hypothetical protein